MLEICLIPYRVNKFQLQINSDIHSLECLPLPWVCCTIYLNQKHPGCKKGVAKNYKKKKMPGKKEVRSKWAAKGQCSVSADRK